VVSSISPIECCRAYELAGELEQIWRQWLVQGLADPDFRSRLAASDGLCLPQLRRALARAEEEHEVRCLVEAAAAKLDPLLLDLRECVASTIGTTAGSKCPRERVAGLRAVAFFVGEAPPAEEGDVCRLPGALWPSITNPRRNRKKHDHHRARSTWPN
jgi:hypothetical protein